MNRIKLSDSFIKKLTSLPETGMGYQRVKVFLKNGKILNDLKVLNSSILIVEGGESISSEDIKDIQLIK